MTMFMCSDLPANSVFVPASGAVVRLNPKGLAFCTNAITVVVSVGAAVVSLPVFGLMPSHFTVSFVLSGAPETGLLHVAPGGSWIDAVNAPAVIGYFDATPSNPVQFSSVPYSLIFSFFTEGVAVRPGENFTVPMFLFGLPGFDGTPAPMSHDIPAGAL